jgi:hypothetical protein
MLGLELLPQAAPSFWIAAIDKDTGEQVYP